MTLVLCKKVEALHNSTLTKETMINPNPKNRGFYFGHDYFIFSMSNHNIEVKEGIFQRLLLTRFVFENFFSYKLLTHWPCP